MNTHVYIIYISYCLIDKKKEFHTSFPGNTIIFYLKHNIWYIGIKNHGGKTLIKYNILILQHLKLVKMTDIWYDF